jgi:hypothetical protein
MRRAVFFVVMAGRAVTDRPASHHYKKNCAANWLRPYHFSCVLPATVTKGLRCDITACSAARPESIIISNVRMFLFYLIILQVCFDLFCQFRININGLAWRSVSNTHDSLS